MKIQFLIDNILSPPTVMIALLLTIVREIASAKFAKFNYSVNQLFNKWTLYG